MIPSTRPVPPPVSLRPVLQGDDLVVPVDGGVRRTQAPTAGIEVGDKFVSRDALKAALVSLAMMERNGRRAPARFKGVGVLP